MPKTQPFAYIVLLAMITLVIAGSLFLVIPKKEVITRFSCMCELPGEGAKEINVLVSGDDLPSSAIAPVNLTLKVYNQTVPCSCESKTSLIRK